MIINIWIKNLNRDVKLSKYVFVRLIFICKKVIFYFLIIVYRGKKEFFKL